MAYFSAASLAHIWLSGWGGEAVVEFIDNTGTNIPSLSDAEAQSFTNSSSGSQTLVEYSADHVINSGSGEQSTSDSEAVTVTIVFENQQFVSESMAESVSSQGDSSQTLVEYSADNVTSTGTSSFDTIDELAEGLRVVATSDQTLEESLAETLTTTQTGVPTIVSYDSDTLTTSATSTQEIVDVVALIEQIVTEGTSTQVTADALAEAVTNNQTNVPSLEEWEYVLDILTNIGTNIPSLEEVIDSPFEPISVVRVAAFAGSLWLVPVLPLKRYEEVVDVTARSVHVLDEVIVPRAVEIEGDDSWIERMWGWLKSLIRRDQKETDREVEGTETLPYIPHGDVDLVPPPPVYDTLVVIPDEEVEFVETDPYEQARKEDEELLALGAFAMYHDSYGER